MTVFLRLNHASRECVDPERMAEFYCRILGAFLSHPIMMA